MGNFLVYTLTLCGQYGIYQKDWKLHIKFVLMGGPYFMAIITFGSGTSTSQ